jgi:hypothetical protein
MNDNDEKLRDAENTIEFGIKKNQAAMTVLGSCGYDWLGQDGDETLYWFSFLLGDEATRIETAWNAVWKNLHTKTA